MPFSRNIIMRDTLGAVHKVRHAIFGHFLPPSPLSHFVTHPGTPVKSMSTISDSPPPPFFIRSITKNPDKSPLYKFSLNCSRGFVRGVCQRVFCLEGFVRDGFCPFLLLSQYICYQRKLNNTLNVMFNMYDKKLYKRDVTCA